MTFGTVPVKLALFQPSQKLSYVRLSSFSKIQLVVYYQCYLLIG